MTNAWAPSGIALDTKICPIIVEKLTHLNTKGRNHQLIAKLWVLVHTWNWSEKGKFREDKSLSTYFCLKLFTYEINFFLKVKVECPPAHKRLLWLVGWLIILLSHKKLCWNCPLLVLPKSIWQKDSTTVDWLLTWT